MKRLMGNDNRFNLDKVDRNRNNRARITNKEAGAEEERQIGNYTAIDDDGRNELTSYDAPNWNGCVQRIMGTACDKHEEYL